ncbi:MAG: hypothetical protein IKF71_04325 [Bacilli bacterium]|nr:hypothetical protein [Bacilli bacterium]
MAFNTLEYLRDGKVDFVFHCTPYDYEHLIESIRKAPNRIEIIHGFLSKLKVDLPSFCFSVIYDIPEFADEAYELLDIKNVTSDMLNNLLNNSPLGLKVLYENFDTFLSFNGDPKYFECIVKYAFDSKNNQLIHMLSRYHDLHIRYLFMDYIIKNHPEQVDEIYDDITKYTTSITYELNEQITLLPQLMNPDDISKLAVALLTNNREKDYKKLKDFILNNYKYNYLASQLLTDEWIVDPDSHRVLNDPNKAKKIYIFSEDADTLFSTSADYRFSLYLRHKDMISRELLDNFASRLKCFLDTTRQDPTKYSILGTPEERDLELIYNCGLGNLLEEWTEKYMELSQSKEYGFVGEGTTCSCYRIGDYVIKLVKTKWSYEDIICPNLYLIAKNYEEIYLRDKDGKVKGGLEVQKYLTRSAKDIDPNYFRYFDLALDRLGYRRTDTLTKGSCGENTMLLDTYRDADCSNPEKVPVWFKKYPLVLIDRDRIYPKDKAYVKQLSNGY